MDNQVRNTKHHNNIWNPFNKH